MVFIWLFDLARRGVGLPEVLVTRDGALAVGSSPRCEDSASCGAEEAVQLLHLGWGGEVSVVVADHADPQVRPTSALPRRQCNAW